MRIQKYLSQEGILSRREAEKAIRDGKVMLNGKIIREMGVQIDPAKDKVEVVGTEKSEEKITVVVYKPRGVVSSTNSAEGKTVHEAFPQFKNLNAVGRLDKGSEGLLLLSNDGVITAAVTSEKHLIEKEYEVTVREDVMPAQLKRMEEGIVLDGEKTLPAKAKKLDKHLFSLILTEGRTHQIRRMADAVHLTIERLVRVRIGAITLKGLNAGKSRMLTAKEVATLKKLR